MRTCVPLTGRGAVRRASTSTTRPASSSASTAAAREAEAEVVHIDPADRHLLLLVRSEGEKSKFLCGHDERHWFVAAIPEAARGVTRRRDGQGRAAAADRRVARRDRLPRKRRFEPSQRGLSCARASGSSSRRRGSRVEPWRCCATSRWPAPAGRRTCCARRTAAAVDVVYVRGANVLSDEGLRAARPSVTRRGYCARCAATLSSYARGTVRHPDHATIMLPGWHRVVMNTERSAKAMRHVIFVD